MSEERIRHVARLARLALSDDEIGRLDAQLERLLSFVRQLQALDTTGVPEAEAGAALVNVTRSDEPSTPLAAGEATRGAPDESRGCFVVPRILEE